MLILPLLAALQAPVTHPDSLPPRPLSQLVHTTWTAREGAPTQVSALAQTSDGYLWIGTEKGLFRFDGVRFVELAALPLRGERRSGRVASLLAARAEGLWIVWGDGEISRLIQDSLTHWRPQDGLPKVFALAQSQAGELVAITAGGLFRLREDRWQLASTYRSLAEGKGRAVWFDRDDALWVLSENKLLHRSAPADTLRDTGISLLYSEPELDFAQARDGTIWVAEMFRSVHAVSRVAPAELTAEVKVGSQDILIDRRGALWVGSAGDGLRRVLDPTRVRGAIAQFGPEAEQYTEKDGLLADIVTALFEDREGNIWIGSSRGIERFHEAAFSPIPLPGVRAREVFTFPDSTIWVSEHNRRDYLRIAPRDTTRIPQVEVQGPPIQDRTGQILTPGNLAVYALKGGQWKPILVPRVGSGLRQMVMDTSGGLWAWNRINGLVRLFHDSTVVVAAGDSTLAGLLYADRHGRVWLAHEHLLILFDQGDVRRFHPETPGWPGMVFNFLDIDRALWAGSALGLSKFENGQFKLMPASQALPGRVVLSMVADADGNMWVLTSSGLFRLPQGEADRALRDSSYRMSYRKFDEPDGWPGLMVNGEWGPLLARGQDGRIWVATNGGIASIDPRALPVLRVPDARIEGLRADGNEQAIGAPIRLAPNPGNIEIDYTAMTLSPAARVRFRYRLSDSDTAWNEVGARRRAYYTRLAPGRYTFEVSTGLDDDRWSAESATLDFQVLPAWYQAWWFRILLGITLVGGSAWLAVRLQRGRHQRSQEALTAKYEGTLAERARIAQDLHDTLMQGFAGVTLQIKSVELSLQDRPEATSQLGRIRELARESLREARELIWEMRDSALAGDGLPAALEAVARERIGRDPITLRVEVQGVARRLPASVEDAAFRIGREAIANAVQHAGCRQLHLLVRFGDSAVDLEISDDGSGFTPAASEEARRHGHFGLSGMRDRAAHAGGRCEIQPRPGGGTIVSLQLPVPA